MPFLLNEISTKGGRGGQKSPKSCLRRIRMPPLVFFSKGGKKAGSLLNTLET